MMRIGLTFSSLFFFLLLLIEGDSLPLAEIGRRDAISKAAAAVSIATTINPSNAFSSLDPSTKTFNSRNIGVKKDAAKRNTIITNENPPPNLSFPSISTYSGLDIPRVGYSFYKTSPDIAGRCAELALRSGITHLDVGTQYESNTEVGKAIRRYLKYGRTKLASNEKSELLEVMDVAYKYQMYRMESKSRKRGSEQRREALFISHKISNEEQSTDPEKIRRSVLEAIDALGIDYLDMVSIHSPLTNTRTRLATYQALVQLKQRNEIIRSIGVCNYGLKPLKEIMAAGLPLPAVNQLELSPFNKHEEVVEWCDQNGVAVSCAAWSKLSGKNGPSEQWGVLSQLASKKGVTKAQVLVRWSLQKGYICLPRSGCGSEIERLAIAENSYGGGVVVKNGKLSKNSISSMEQSAILTPEELAILDGLDIKYKAGRLGRTDGWRETDIKGINWDPTEI